MRTRLVAFFLPATLVPLALLALVCLRLIETSIDDTAETTVAERLDPLIQRFETRGRSLIVGLAQLSIRPDFRDAVAADDAARLSVILGALDRLQRVDGIV